MGKYDCELRIEANNALSLLLERIAPGSIVLEFGPAHGRMSQYLKETLGCEVYAVEIDETAAADAAKFCERIVVEGIEDYGWATEFAGIHFDYIIFADVLEHLYEPKKVLLEAKKFLKESASLLISVPNIAHNAIIMELLNNRFTYRSVGILDDTHIRFFTKHSFDALIEECALVSVYEGGVYAKPEMTEFECRYDSLPSPVATYLQEREYSEVYQLVYELKMTHEGKKGALLTPKKVGVAQLYIDTGKGFCEESSLILENPQNMETLTFDLHPFGEIFALRFDPMDGACVVHLLKVELEKNDGKRRTLSAEPVNAIFHVNGGDYFTNRDPAYLVKFDEIAVIATRVHVTLHYLTLGDEKVQKATEDVFLSHIELLNGGIKTLNNDIELLSGEVRTLNSGIELLENSLSWKITKPLRYVRKLF